MNARTVHELLPSRQGPPARSHVEDVQLAVRVPAELRRRVREVAQAEGTTVTELVESAVTAELLRRTDPAAAFAADVAASLQRRLAEALANGDWDAVAEEMSAGDPDLAPPRRS